MTNDEQAITDLADVRATDGENYVSAILNYAHEQRKAVLDLRDALKAVSYANEPMRGQYELWSLWQARVRDWKQSREILERTK